MKKSLLLFSFLLFVFCSLIAQVPKAFNYQAVVRDNSGAILANQNVSFQIGLIQSEANGGKAVYSEIHNVTTNAFGLVNLQIGRGTDKGGAFSPDQLPYLWVNEQYSIKILIDPEGGTSYRELSETELLSVPYAFHAETVERDSVKDDDSNPFNEIQTLSLSGTELTLSKNGGTVTLPSAGGGDNWGTQKVVSDATITGEGTNANPLSVDGDLTDDQTLSISGNELRISDGNTVTLPSAEGSSLWSEEEGDIIYNMDRIGIGLIPNSNDSRQLQVKTDNRIAISAENNTDGCLAALFAQNYGTGPAADFRNRIRIFDGTEGEGKVLTSDGSGYSSWQTPAESLWKKDGNDLFITTGNIGIGTASPLADIDMVTTNATISLKATGSSLTKMGNAALLLDKKEKTGYADIIYRTDGISKFYTGLLENNNYRISASSTALSGLEVEADGDVVVSNELHAEAKGSANMLPFAYGYIGKTGTKESVTSNVGSITKSGTGQYKIAISDLGSDYIAMVTPCVGAAMLTGVVLSRGTTSVTVAIWDTKNDTYYDGGFSFIIYKP